jgi:aryl-alcohol dehydrogenase-like predicted oxidoreductase
MQKQRFGRTGLSISPVIFGGIINMYESLENAQYYVDFAVDAGVNYFDVAPTYNDAESRLGPTLKKHRADVYLACKTTKRDAAGAKEELLHSLAVLETGYFDVCTPSQHKQTWIRRLDKEVHLRRFCGPGKRD